ncbi:hypothetical protein CYMTET_35958 [Cymbomonas tetramitiformis]|uniref:Uncharacterized protein n=1 Tax=Cymbomonas tetramitiformis TaxID=36881 RepID=A0AAE0F885_9CHLO|nr:hypothetical protein CYMTET_35958 [Cymbomonas tetramitiformis]
MSHQEPETSKPIQKTSLKRSRSAEPLAPKLTKGVQGAKAPKPLKKEAVIPMLISLLDEGLGHDIITTAQKEKLEALSFELLEHESL